MVRWFGLDKWCFKSIVVVLVFLVIASAFASAVPPHKDHPGKGKKNPIVDPVDNVSVVWVSNVFGGFVFIVSDEGVWGGWSSWWFIWNILSDVPVVDDTFSVSVSVKYRINGVRG